MNEHLQKKVPNFLWAPCGRYQDIRLLLQNPKLLRNAMDFNSHNLYNKSKGPLSFLVLSQFEFLSFVTILVVELCQSLGI